MRSFVNMINNVKLLDSDTIIILAKLGRGARVRRIPQVLISFQIISKYWF